MFAKSLMVAALLSSVVVGCDDPEVAAKVAGVLEYGAVTAELHCPLFSVSTNVCGSSPLVELDVYDLLDGSNIIQTVIINGAGQGLQFNPRGVGFTQKLRQSSGSLATLTIDDGVLDLTTNACSAPDNAFSVDLTSHCSGRNLEAFGIDP